jgi:hypothetical protein
LSNAASSSSAAAASSSTTASDGSIRYPNNGGFTDRADLIDRLRDIFPPEAEGDIRRLVKDYTLVGGYPRQAVTVFNLIVNQLQGIYTPNFAVAQSGANSKHGAQIPTRVATGKLEDIEAANSAMKMGSVTLGTFNFWYGDASEQFTARQKDKDVHAEDNLLDQFADYRKLHPTIDWSEAKVNLTITNFFCGPDTTKKKNGRLSCLERIIALHAECEFKEFHVYFRRSYGQHMDEYIGLLQDAGIKVSRYVGQDQKKVYSNKLLDSASDSDDDLPRAASAGGSFGYWQYRLGLLVRAGLGVDLADLPDIAFREYFDAGASPEDAYDELADNFDD